VYTHSLQLSTVQADVKTRPVYVTRLTCKLNTEYSEQSNKAQVIVSRYAQF